MSEFAEMARAFARFDGDVSQVSDAELNAARQTLLVASAATAEVLLDMCGGDPERVRLELLRAYALPPSVLKRRAKEVERIVRRDGFPNRAQTAAHIAVMTRTAEEIAAWIERRQPGAVVN